MKRAASIAVVVVAVQIAAIPSLSAGAPLESTSVKSLRAYKHAARTQAPDPLPSSAEEILTSYGGDAATLRHAARLPSGDSISFHGRRGALCALLLVSPRASAFCSTALREAGGRLDVSVSILAGKTVAWGLAANDVREVQATVDGTRRRGTVAANVFLVELPDGSRGSGPITLTATGADGSAAVQRLPGIPRPAG